MHRSLLALLLVAAAPWARPGAPADTLPVAVTVGDAGLGSLRVGGTELLADGAPRLAKVVLRRADGSTALADKKILDTARDAETIHLRYAWGSLYFTYAAAPGRFGLTIIVANASQDTLHEIWLRPLALRLAGEGLKVPRPRDNVGAPSVLTLEHDGGVLALCNHEIDRPLHLRFDRPSKGAVPVVVFAGGDRMVYDELYMRRPIPPGKSDAYTLSLRFGPVGSDPHDLADDIYAKYAARHPPKLDWPDRRPILRLFLGGGLPRETVLAYYRNGEKGPLPPPDPKAGEAILAKLDRAVAAARQVDAQGIILWDIEGDAMAHPVTYIGDPRLAKTLNPTMDAVADDYFARIRKAGLRAGVCIRPSHVVFAKDKGTLMQSFGAAKDPFRELDAKARYCKQRWGCTLFYVDTNYFWRPRGEGGKWTPGMLDADVWRRLHEQHPKVLFVPEHNYPQYWAYTAPYQELDCGYRGIPAWVRRVYPKAFCVPVIEDADPNESHDLLVRMVRDGDCPMTFIYGLTRNARAIVRIRAEAKLLDQGEPQRLVGAGVARLAALVSKGDLRERFYAARRLGSQSADEAVGALIARAADPQEHWLVRKNAVIALGQLKAQRAVGVLGRLLKSRDADLKHFATQALARISKAVAPTGLDDDPDGLSLDPLPAP